MLKFLFPQPLCKKSAMAIAGGLCPQRRIASGTDPEAHDPESELFFPQKRSLKYCSVSRSCDGESRRLGEGDARGFCVKSLNFLQLVVIILAVLVVSSSGLIYGSGVFLARANDFGRQCTDLRISGRQKARTYKFAMVTCSDGSSSIPQRSFQGLMELVTPNKKAYVKRHGYDFIDASDCLDKDRPPSWSKILAVRKHLPNYDWVFWNDVDSLVTNPSVALEDVIESIVGTSDFEHMPDFIVTQDVTGVNAGMFFFRNSEWSEQFLDLWWNQTSFIKPFGHCKSGDNDALKHLIKKMPESEKKQHVRIPQMQCVFNSNLWRPSWKNSHRLVTLTRAVWQGVYSRGDFMIHFAGLDNKKTWIEKVLKDMEEDSSSPLESNRSRRTGPS